MSRPCVRWRRLCPTSRPMLAVGVHSRFPWLFSAPATAYKYGVGLIANFRLPNCGVCLKNVSDTLRKVLSMRKVSTFFAFCGLAAMVAGPAFAQGVPKQKAAPAAKPVAEVPAAAAAPAAPAAAAPAAADDKA